MKNYDRIDWESQPSFAFGLDLFFSKSMIWESIRESGLLFGLVTMRLNGMF